MNRFPLSDILFEGIVINLTHKLTCWVHWSTQLIAQNFIYRMSTKKMALDMTIVKSVTIYCEICVGGLVSTLVTQIHTYNSERLILNHMRLQHLNILENQKEVVCYAKLNLQIAQLCSTLNVSFIYSNVQLKKVRLFFDCLFIFYIFTKAALI